MMTMAGNRMAIIPHPPTYHLANKERPKLTEKEEEIRNEMLTEVRGYEKEKSLKKCETDDRSQPLVLGKVASSSGWSEPSRVSRVQTVKGSPPGKPGMGRGGLGDLFSGGFKPNPGALKSSGGRGRGVPN